MNILYTYGDNLYVNLTNRCPCRCVFCVRHDSKNFGSADDLWLDHEPSYDEVVEAFEKEDLTKYNEIVFCGFGEPLMRADLVIDLARYLKIKRKAKNVIRINTNGLANLVHGKNILPDMAGCIDALSISLNAPNSIKYDEITRNKFGETGYIALIAFIAGAKQFVPSITLSVVDTYLTNDEIEECRKIAETLGVKFLVRELIVQKEKEFGFENAEKLKNEN